MRVNAINNTYFKINTNKNNIKNSSMPMQYQNNLACDTVSFGAMKKSKFQGTDLAVINKFKAPIEKFNTNEEFQNWCKEKTKEEYSDGYYMAQDMNATFKRESILNDWNTYLTKEDNDYTEAQKLFIMNGITRDLKKTTNTMPSILNKEVLKQTMDEIDEEFINNGAKRELSFNKIYSDNLRANYLQGIIPDENGNNANWVIIPSRSEDIDNFEYNAEMLQALSHKEWCTKSYKAPAYITNGAFHIYIDEGKTRIGIKYNGDTIEEIQGEGNDSNVSEKYIPVLLEHVQGEKQDFQVKLQLGCLQYKYENKDSEEQDF